MFQKLTQITGNLEKYKPQRQYLLIVLSLSSELKKKTLKHLEALRLCLVNMFPNFNFLQVLEFHHWQQALSVVSLK